MIKRMILLTMILLLNGCVTSLPSVSDKSNAMLEPSEWEKINTQNIKGSIK